MLKEKLLAKQAELKALEEKIKSGDEEAIKAGEAISQEIEGLEALIEKAEKATAMISRMGNPAEKPEEENEIKAAHLEELKIAKGSRSFGLKAYTDNEAMGENKIVSYDRNVPNAQPALNVRALFGAETISGNALTYYKLGTLEGSFSTVSEGGAKPQVHVPYTAVTVALTKIAGFMKETDELLQDAPFLESAIRGRGIYEFNKAVEDYLIGALTGTSGVQSGESAITFDNLLKAKQAVRATTGYAADTIVINPTDLETLLLAKDGASGTSGQYLLGGPSYGPYGNGNFSGNPRIWGLNVVESGAVSAGQCIVGAFKAGSSVVTKAGEGLRVEVSNSDQDDFIKNRITVRIEERMVLATRVPAAFVLVGTASSSS